MKLVFSSIINLKRKSFIPSSLPVESIISVPLVLTPTKLESTFTHYIAPRSQHHRMIATITNPNIVGSVPSSSAIQVSATPNENSSAMISVGVPFESLNKASLQQLSSSVPFKNSIATVCLKGNNTIYDKIEAIATAGFQGVEIMDFDLSDASATEIYNYCQLFGLEISMFQPFRDFEGSPLDSDKFKDTLTRFKETLEIMKELHTDLLLICANCEEDSVCDKDLFVEQLRMAADLAAEQNMRIAYEALSWSTHISTLEDLYDIVKRVDRSNFGLCLDSFHIVAKECDLELIKEIGQNGKIMFVQLCDAPLLNLSDLRFYARNYRNYPYQGEYDLAYQVDLIYKSGYNGYLSLEVFNHSFRNSGTPKVLADDGLRSLLYLQKKAIPDYIPETTKVFSDSSEDGTRTEDLINTPVELYGIANANGQDVVYTENLQNLSVAVSNKETLLERAKLMGYESLFHLSIELSEYSSNLAVKEKLCQRVVSKTNSRLEFNRQTLFLKTCLDLSVIADDSLNSFNEYKLPLSLSFGNANGFVVTLVIHPENDVKL